MGTTETTDFDVYNPMRTLHYLVKTTMPGGGNFANKLAPGYVYVWNGIKPRCALKDMMDSLIYKEDKFKKHVGKEKDPKPIITNSTKLLIIRSGWTLKNSRKLCAIISF